MPHRVIKTVWDYCAYSKKFFAFIIILIFISSLIQNEFHRNLHMYEWLAFQVISTIVVAGYGMVITRDRINHGVRLPKIVIKDSAVDAICHGADLACGGIASLADNIQKNDIVAIETLKGELVGAGNSLLTSNEILEADAGFAVNVSKVFMKPDTYPRFWK